MYKGTGFLLSNRKMAIAFVCAALILQFSTLAFPMDLADIKEKGVLRHLGIPYANFISQDGQEGLDVELIKLFAQHLGVRYEYVATTWESVVGDLTGKKFSINGDRVEVVGKVPVRGDVIANGFTVLSAREKMLDYSIPTFPTQIWLVARSDSPVRPIMPSGNIDTDILAVRSLLKGYRVLGKLNTCLDPSLYSLEETGASVVIFDGDLSEVVPVILRGDADLSLLDMPDALIALEKWPGEIKIIGPLSRAQSMACAFDKGSDLLRESFNVFFKKLIQDGTYVKLVKKYYPAFSVYYPEYFSNY